MRGARKARRWTALGACGWAALLAAEAVAQPTFYDPIAEAEAKDPTRPRFAPPEASPGPSGVQPTLPAATPDAVRSWLYKERGVLAVQVEVREVALDLDPDAEVLASVTFPVPEGRSPRWIFLLDRRGEAWEVARAWDGQEVTATAEVIAHGRGQRAALQVRLEGGAREEVEVVQLLPGGALRVLGAVGAAAPAELIVERSGVVTLRLDAARTLRWRLETREEGFAFTPQP